MPPKISSSLQQSQYSPPQEKRLVDHLKNCDSEIRKISIKIFCDGVKDNPSQIAEFINEVIDKTDGEQQISIVNDIIDVVASSSNRDNFEKLLRFLPEGKTLEDFSSAYVEEYSADPDFNNYIDDFFSDFHIEDDFPPEFENFLPCQYAILRVLPENSLHLFLNKIEGIEYIAELLELLFDRATTFEEKILLVTKFTNCVEERIILFIYALEESTYSIHPFFPIAFSKNNLNTIASFFNKKNLNNELNLFVSDKIDENQKISARLHKSPELRRFFCEQVSLNMSSQDSAQWMSLNNLCLLLQSIIKEGDLDSFMTELQEDFENISPFLIGIALYNPNYRLPLLEAAKYMCYEQLSAIAKMTHTSIIDEVIDTLINNLSEHQYPSLIEDLPKVTRDRFEAKVKATALSHAQKIKEIDEQITTLNENQSNTPKEELAKELTKLQLSLNKNNLIFSQPIYRYFKLKPETFGVDPKKILEANAKQIREITAVKEKTKTKESIISFIPEKVKEYLKIEEESDLKGFGILSHDDIEMITSLENPNREKVERYLRQKNLNSLWIFLNSQSFYSLSGLDSACLFDDDSDVFSLEPIAISMGMETKKKRRTSLSD